MKHFSPGLSDSIASVVPDPVQCPHCDSSSHIAGGLCVGCLLQSGLDTNDGCAPEALQSALAEITLPDQNWRLGNYEILEEIGRGGMGVIYRARQRHSRRIVAVKRVLGYHADSRETLARFRREAQAAASLDHPNILPIYEVSESEDGLPFFSMKFAPGGNLQQIASALRNDARQSVALVAKIARAVQHAHGKGILHRDLKPGNILLDAHGEPLVSDFGLAKWLDATSDLTRTLTIFGTPGYIAPEQASGSAAQLKPASDVYSLGAILFDLLAGRPPFLGSHALSVIRQAAETPAPKLRTLSKVADRDLETICARCLDREPSLRYRSARELAEDLERWLEGRPIIARPVPAPIRIWRWSRRNKKLASSLAMCVLLAASAAIWQTQNRRLELSVREGQLEARSIAVLPLLNLDNARSDETLAQVVVQELQTGLSEIAPAKVIPMRSVEPWLAGTGEAKDIISIAAQARVRAVLTGSQRTVDGKLRTTLRLLSASSGEVLLRRVFETTLGQTAIAQFVGTVVPDVDALLNTKTWTGAGIAKSDPGLRNPTAREFLVSGRQLMFRATIVDIDRGIGCFERAIQLEPESATAHAFLASALGGRNHYAPDSAKLQRAEEEARIAQRLEPNSADAHRALGGVYYQRGQLGLAQEEQFRAVEAGGTEERIATFIGLISAAIGEPVRALGWLKMAQHWATLPGDYDALMGNSWTLLLEDGPAEAAYRRAIELRPDIPDGWVGLSNLKLRQGDFKAARQVCQDYQGRFQALHDPDSNARELEALIELFDRNYPVAEQRYRALSETDHPEGGTATSSTVDFDSALGRLLQIRGENDTAHRILKQSRTRETKARALERPATSYYRLAAIESCLGNTEAALQHLRAAVAAGWLDVRSLQLDPRFDAVAAEDGFHEISAALRTKIAELQRKMERPNTETTK
jgi:serine/threonine protein kinase/tetratricopeptide (TPR) repeat protein